MSDESNVRNGGMGRRVSEVHDLLLEMAIVPPAAASDFVDRLASEHDWTRDRAQRAYDEYVRFLLMAWVSPDMVVPPHDVDQAWHLHLTHSRHYWDVLCATILQRPFHHEPSLGGEAEGARHVDAYSRTLALYACIFDEEAPHDVWPRGCACTRHEAAKQVVMISNPFIPVAIFGGVAAAIAWGCGYGWMSLAIVIVTVGIATSVASWARSEREDYESRAERTRRDRATREARAARQPIEMDRAGNAARLGRMRERTRTMSSSSRSSSWNRSGDDAGASFAAIMAADSSSSSSSHSHGHSSHSSHSCSSSPSHSCGSSGSSHSCSSSSSSSCGGSSCGGSCGSSS